MNTDEKKIYDLISEKEILLNAIQTLLSSPEDKNDELLKLLNSEKEKIIVFILDLLKLKKYLKKT